MSINPNENKSSSLFYNSAQKLSLKIKNPINKLSPKKLKSNDTYETSEESPDELLSKILDTINTNSLNVFYPDSNNEFKKKIDSLNLEFYLETEKFLTNKNHSEKCQTSLFTILFKQINIYIEEIERLNLIIMKKRYDPKKIIERTDEIIKKQNEFLTKENLIKALKDSKSNMENKLLKAIISEDKLKKEIEILKKEKEQYKNQIINNNNNNTNDNIINNDSNKNNMLHKITYSLLNSKTMDNIDISNNGISQYDNKNFISIINTRKRNNSDHNKFKLNNSLNKFESKGFNKYREKINEKLRNQKNTEKKVNYQVYSSYMPKKKQISIKLIDENYGLNTTGMIDYRGIHTNINKIQILENKNKYNIDNCSNEIKQIKTEYIISDLSDINKYSKKNKNCLSKSREIRDKNKDKKDKDINIINKDKEKDKDKDKKNNNINNSNYKDKDIKDNLLLISCKQNPIFLGKNSNKKKVKINK